MLVSGLFDQTIPADVMGAASDLAGSATDLAGSALDSAGSVQGSVGDSMDSIGTFWGSILDSVSSAKDQAADTALDSVGSLKAQVGELGANALSPFQRLGEAISSGVAGQLESLKSGAQGAVEGAQTQLGQSVTETIGNPLQDSLGDIFSKFGTSPEELLKEEQTWSTGLQETVKGVEKVATPSTLFYAENAAILPLWAGMIIWPDKPLTKTVMSSYATVVVAAVVYLWLTYECFQNPVALEGFASGITDLGGLTKGFGEEVSVVTAWSHFLAEDLFIGRWVYLDGQKNDVFTKHSLALCYLFGPVGFLSHLATRTAFSVIKPGIKDIMEGGVSQQPSKPSPAAPPVGLRPAPPSGAGREVVAKARREAETIISRARSEGAAQAASLLQAAETEALDILKEAEVERSALLKATKTVPPAEDKVEPAADVTKADATTPDVSEPKVSTSTPLNPPPSPEAANPP
eukprot:jgi/Undpi1/10667/HiC_scaffold_29.g13116.m1